MCLSRKCVGGFVEAIDSSATDSGTEDVLGSQMLSKNYRDHAMRHVAVADDQPQRYRPTKLESRDVDWMAQRKGRDTPSARAHKV